MTKAVVLCAGRGRRLAPLTDRVPKPLVPVCKGLTLIDFVLNYLKAKTQKIALVVGYKGHLIEEHAKKRNWKVEVIKVDELYKGNLYSLLAAKDWASDEDFLIANADHAFPPRVWEVFPEGKGELELLCHPKGLRPIGEDEMKVKVKGELLEAVSKKLDSYDGAYVGLAWVSGKAVKEFWEVAQETLNEKGPDAVVEDAFLKFKKARAVFSDVPFYEVDTLEDLRRLRDACESGLIGL